MSMLSSFVQCVKDFFNFFRFKKDMKNEFYTRDSLFNKYKLQCNWLGNVVYVQLDFSDEDLMNANYDSETMLFRRLQPIIEYLSRDMDWGDYLTPQISNFVDEDGNPSLSYGVLFIYTPVKLTMLKLLVGTLSMIALAGVSIWGIVRCLA